MEKFFRYLGHKAGPSIRKGKWIYHSFFADKEQAIESEYLVGKELAINVLSEFQKVDDAETQQLISEIYRRLTDCLTNKKRKFQISVIISADLNAFALPGGFIFITNSLIKLLEYNPDRIAYVAAHEMTHVILKHPLNLMLSNYSLQMIEKFIRTRGAVGGLAKQAISGFIRNGYSQEKELEADKYGVQLMTYARYNALAATEVLQKLSALKDDQSEILNYFSTHPPAGERIAAIKNHLKNMSS
jgi:beta-barrel assembly-enhancing protease